MDPTFKATKTVELDYGHRVPNHDSKCYNVHGHRGKLEVTVTGCLLTAGSSTDMVMDFGHIKQLMIKEIVELFDHCLILYENDPLTHRYFEDTELIEINDFGARYKVPDLGIVQELSYGAPTAEVLAYACWKVLEDKLPKGCKLACVRFWETPNSVAEYEGSVALAMSHAG